MGHIRVRGLGKAYKRYAYRWGRLAEWMGLGTHHELMWVLQGITFDVAPGEAVALVGSNGAGKSTLLKVIAGTVKPTVGTFEVAGRVSAMLELGIGFHPDFSGRQNVHMAAHLAGIARDDLGRVMEDVEAFAEIGEYIDWPVRTYSSGMQVRLAFSVATAVRPDILIVDEALAVGDTYFQHKSFDRIRQFRDQGTTLLFVSHSPGVVKTLCSRALLIDRGVLVRDDAPDAVLDYYNAIIAAQHADYGIRQAESESRRVTTRSGTAEAVIEKIELLSRGRDVRAVNSGEAVTVRVHVMTRAALPELTAGMLIRDRLGNDVFGTNTYRLARSRSHVDAGQRLTVDFHIEHFDVGAGSYSLTAALHTADTHIMANYDWWDGAVVFQVVPGMGTQTIGVCALSVTAEWHRDGSDALQGGYDSAGEAASKPKGIMAAPVADKAYARRSGG